MQLFLKNTFCFTRIELFDCLVQEIIRTIKSFEVNFSSKESNRLYRRRTGFELSLSMIFSYAFEDTNKINLSHMAGFAG